MVSRAIRGRARMSKKCYGMDCFGTYFTHVQTCDVTRVQSATAWTASVHTSHILYLPLVHKNVLHIFSARLPKMCIKQVVEKKMCSKFFPC